MRYLHLVLLPLILVACEREATAPDIDTVPTLAATHITDNSFDFHWGPFTFYLPCADEQVFAEGDIHFLVTETLTPSGNYIYTFMGQPMGLKGVGLTSGLDYKFTGLTRQSYFVQGDGFPVTLTYLNLFYIVGPGGNRAAVHDTYKLTVNGVGDIAVEHQTYTAECF